MIVSTTTLNVLQSNGILEGVDFIKQRTEEIFEKLSLFHLPLKLLISREIRIG